MRKIRITVLALALAVLCTATALAAGTQAVGDVNGSGDVDMTDMQCLYELLSTGKYSGSLSGEAGRRAADINGDGTVDILDYQRLYDILRQQVDYSNPVYEYDENGRAIRKCYYDATGRINRYWEYEYDADNRKIAAVSYDASGNVLSYGKGKHEANGEQTWTYYDPATNKVTCIEVFDANKTLRQSTEYDPATGKVACVWEYDETGTLRKSTEYNTDTGKAVCVQEYDENGAVRKYTSYDRETGEILSVSEFDEQGREIGFKKFNNGTLSFHWTAVYDESGAQIRTYYDTVTGSASNIEKREYDWTNKTCTITQYDVQTGKKYCVAVYDMSDQNNWKLLKETYYDENGNITSETVY